MANSAFLDRAYTLAHSYTRTHPNPRVGAVVVDTQGSVVGEGWHEGPGTVHAEVMALETAGERARGATLYVSLEPCNHYGKTPPCTEAILGAKVAAVVIGIRDPDRDANRGGVEHLQDHGVEVAMGDDLDRARSLDEAYFSHRETGMPMVTIKWAMTLDGSIAAADGTSQWITGEGARKTVHEMRAQSDAVVIGAGTLIDDDPRLDARDVPQPYPQPTPVIVAGRRPLPASAQLWEREPLVVSAFERDLPGGNLVLVDGDGIRPDPVAACQSLADLGHLQIMLEGGPTLTEAWWHAGVITNGLVYIGAKVGGGTGRAPMTGVFSTIGDADDVEFDTVRNVSGDAVIAFRKK